MVSGRRNRRDRGGHVHGRLRGAPRLDQSPGGRARPPARRSRAGPAGRGGTSPARRRLPENQPAGARRQRRGHRLLPAAGFQGGRCGRPREAAGAQLRCAHAGLIAASSGRVGRLLTLAPSSRCRAQKVSDEMTVMTPMAKYALCRAGMVWAGSVWSTWPRNHAVSNDAKATPKLSDICWPVLARLLALLASRSATSAKISEFMLVNWREAKNPWARLSKTMPQMGAPGPIWVKTMMVQPSSTVLEMRICR